MSNLDVEIDNRHTCKFYITKLKIFVGSQIDKAYININTKNKNKIIFLYVVLIDLETSLLKQISCVIVNILNFLTKVINNVTIMTVLTVIIFVTLTVNINKKTNISKTMANVNKQKLKHIIVSYENFEKLRRFGYATDSMNDVITKILEKNKMLESDSRVEARDQQILTETKTTSTKRSHQYE